MPTYHHQDYQAFQNYQALRNDARRARENYSSDESSAKISSDVQKALKKPRLIIDKISPSVDSGRYPAKATQGQVVTVRATIFADGHNRLAARLLWKEESWSKWSVHPMVLLGNDLWEADFIPEQPGKYNFKIEAWLDRWQNYHHELHQKYHAGINVKLEAEEGRLLLQEMVDTALINKNKKRDEEALHFVDALSWEESLYLAGRALQELHACAEDNVDARVQILLRQELAHAVERLEPRQFLASTRQPYLIDVERTKAGFSSWYELFPRSITSSVKKHGTFDDVIDRLPAIQAMGFDVLYFPPIHPIGRKFRKGRNNNVTAEPGEPGSPYAIGGEAGGHDAVHPELGGIEAFRRLRDAAKQYGLEIALDFAIQCSPDHPWLTQHPDWFSWRPDGSIRYAENPPKKYQDIVNVDFYSPEAMPPMWLAWRDIILYWISEGVTIFRVDNPHTKPLPFWEWLIADVRAKNPQAMFLSEAFTRPAMMYQLAKIGFSQSYTYFIWRNSKQELMDYLTELASPPVRDFYRPHFFVNTPDINPFFNQHSGRGGFLIRSALAATLSGLWGLYSGFEYCEAAALPGKEEYLDSEKYEIKPRDFAQAGNIIKEITLLNRIRRENPALQSHLNIRFHESHNEQVIFFSKATRDHSNVIFVAVSLNPHQAQHAHLQIPRDELGENNMVTELVRNIDLSWGGDMQHWYFDPQEIPFAIWQLKSRRV
ncbi:MAG: alpha-1,4-glucan--maltose-1-phosphate maltosyltransferase [Cellvibrionaceae bacterium]|nr:alpha-1,4-glucan--maltose-1-phosphate maltosyltransferase [Cellvibrionaceae bacterium]